ncbi:MAG: hypothetical protein QM599_12110 [Pseudoxanthomonas sp.]
MKRDSDWLAVAAIAALAFVLETALHEHGGHALACAALGGHVREFGAFHVDCDYRAMGAAAIRWVALAGPIMSLCTGIVAANLLTRCRRPLPALFCWLIASVGYLTAFGYPLFSAVGGIGDLGVGPDGALHGVAQPWLWRVPMGVLGYLCYDRAVVWSMRRLGDIVGGGEDRVRRIRRIALIAYLAIGVVAVLIGLLNPHGIVIVLVSAVASSLGGMSGFAWGPYRAAPSADDPRPRNVLPRSVAWIVVSLLGVLAYGIVFGPTIMN